MTLPLEGLRVIDFSWIIAGPFTTLWLATMGAEVIKVESSVHTDLNRRLPPFADGVDGIDRSGLHHGLNMSKKSCTIDLTKTRGQELALDLVRQSDVVVENFAYGQMERFNLGYDRLREAKPDILFLTSAGLGKTGPHREFVTFGPPLLALTGLASITGYEDERPERWIGGVWADHLSGMTACLHLLAALEHRERTGEGQMLEYSMVEAVMAQLPEAYIDYTANGRVWSPSGNRDPVFAPHGFYPCTGDDRWVAIAVDSDEAWSGLCRVMGRTDWGADRALASATGRRGRVAELDQEIAAWSIGEDADTLAERLQAAGVAAASASNSERLLADEQLQDRGFFVEIDHAEVGRRKLSGLPWKISDAEPRIDAPPPLGGDTLSVMTELLGLDDAEFATLVGDGILV